MLSAASSTFGLSGEKGDSSGLPSEEAISHRFIDLAVRCKALQFGSFTLRSGRVSPYFFNISRFMCSGDIFSRLCSLYAAKIMRCVPDLDMLFGVAYKGIPMVAACACLLASSYAREVPFAFSRKEKKRHGEEGNLVGSPLVGRVLVLDDVITAGSSFRSVYPMLQLKASKVAALVVALDRQERGIKECAVSRELEVDFGIRVFAIASVTSLLSYLSLEAKYMENFDKISTYRQHYGAA